MTRQEVTKILGTADETRAANGVEYMMYELNKELGVGEMIGCVGGGLLTFGILFGSPLCGSANDYFVKLTDGRVNAYGRVGDFGSTQTPESTININGNGD